MIQKISLALLFIFTGICAFAQQGNIYFHGKVVKGSEPLYNATIYNINQSFGTVTDRYGDFAIMANINDTIKISSIGYKTVYFVLPDTINEQKYRVLVNMVEDTVLLKEAVVVPWPVNRTMLKRAMLDNRSEKERIGGYAGFRTVEGPVSEPEPKLMNPVSFLYDKLNKQSRQQRKMDKYRRIIEEGERTAPPPPSEKPVRY
jgi:hypothetical protein